MKVVSVNCINATDIPHSFELNTNCEIFYQGKNVSSCRNLWLPRKPKWVHNMIS